MALTDSRADGQGHHGLKVARGRAIQSEGLKASQDADADSINEAYDLP